MRINCKGPLRQRFVFFYLENQIYIFQTTPVVVDSLTSVLSTSGVTDSGVTDYVSVYVKISPFVE